jgi:hypothetical protein
MIRFLQPPSEAILGAMKSMHHSHERLQMTQADKSRVKNMRHIDSNKVQLYAVRMVFKPACHAGASFPEAACLQQGRTRRQRK